MKKGYFKFCSPILRVVHLNWVERVDSGSGISGRVVQRCREQDANTSQHGYDQKSLEKSKGTLDITRGHLPFLDRVRGSYPGLLAHLVPSADGRQMWPLNVTCSWRSNVSRLCFSYEKCHSPLKLSLPVFLSTTLENRFYFILIFFERRESILA